MRACETAFPNRSGLVDELKEQRLKAFTNGNLQTQVPSIRHCSKSVIVRTELLTANIWSREPHGLRFKISDSTRFDILLSRAGLGPQSLATFAKVPFQKR